jgi:hypothetical protein
MGAAMKSVDSLVGKLSAQSSVARLAPAYAMWLVPAVLGVALAWPRWLTLALLVPGLIWYGCGEGVHSYNELRVAHPREPVGRYIPALYAAAFFVVVVVFAGRFAGVLVLAGFAYVDLVSAWRRARRSRVSIPSPGSH